VGKQQRSSSKPSRFVQLTKSNKTKKKGEVTMAEVKMGTQYAREIIENFRETAAGGKFPEINDKLKEVADKLEVVCTKIYFKTQKGNAQFEQIAGELANVKATLDGAADVAAAKAFIDPYFTTLDEVIEMVSNMKVRMT
jgi:uncharacterized protein YpuA (DUF1002 family)